GEWIDRLYHYVPWFASAAEFSYRFIAAHRNLFYRIIRILWGKSVQPVSFVYTRKLFLRLLGVVYFVAFVSLASQIIGLIGKNGISPSAQYLQYFQENLGSERYVELPTLGWLGSSDMFLQMLCWSGAALSVLLVIDV